jgi:hypothetical protein
MVPSTYRPSDLDGPVRTSQDRAVGWRVIKHVPRKPTPLSLQAGDVNLLPLLGSADMV